ncbi:MAG TPA: hypothetical protein VG275_13325, partial [Solirubrobacteraceae bacterium]|nr:hypothetical protein [Solirubrobacteraceae bacterium]
KLGSGHPGGALQTITGGGRKASSALGLGALVTWVLGGAAFALHETATLLGKTTNPELGAAWFSSTYLHMAAIATLLTLPFLFAAAVQALMRSDLAMLVRAAFGYLPLAMLAIGIAAPLTTLLLAASDGVSGTIEQAAGGQGTDFLFRASVILGGLSAVARSPFVAFLLGFFIAAGALMLWLELVLREVAVYVVVLTLPLVFAAFVWPARRIWAIRAVELLVALILAKLAIVSVLALGAGALDHATHTASIISLLAGMALVTLGAFAPWVLVKLMPLGELAAAAAGPLRGHLDEGRRSGAKMAVPWADASSEQAENIVAGMRRMAMDAEPAASGAHAEADRLGDLESASDMDGVAGVAAGDDPDPLRGTADRADGETSNGGGGPGGAGGSAGSGGAGSGSAGSGGAGPPGFEGEVDAPSPREAQRGPAPATGLEGEGDSSPVSGTDRGPAPPFAGLPHGEAYWSEDADHAPLVLGLEGVAPSAGDDDPRPPAQDPEDGRL